MLKVVDEYPDFYDVDIFLFANWYIWQMKIYKQILNAGMENKCIYWMLEPDVVMNWHDLVGAKNILSYVPMIATSNEDLVDKKRIMYLPISEIAETECDKWSINTNMQACFQTKKLITNITGNKSFLHPNEAYSERRKLIRWFEQNHLEEFDLYGAGWTSDFLSYQGECKDKTEIYLKYKFAICFENIKKGKHCISEKIFDCFRGRVVPIYMGSSDIKKLIPQKCYILYEDFSSVDELYCYLKNIKYEEWKKYIDNADIFLASSNSERFRTEYMRRKLFEIIKQLEKHKKFTVTIRKKIYFQCRYIMIIAKNKLINKLIYTYVWKCISPFWHKLRNKRGGKK